MGNGAPKLNEQGKFSDSDYNRKYFRENVHARIIRETNDMIPGFDWKESWRITFREINRSSENPNYKKNFIRSKRKAAGLPIWDFMLK